jgi:hypothetical protein
MAVEREAVLSQVGTEGRWRHIAALRGGSPGELSGHCCGGCGSCRVNAHDSQKIYPEGRSGWVSTDFLIGVLLFSFHVGKLQKLQDERYAERSAHEYGIPRQGRQELQGGWD